MLKRLMLFSTEFFMNWISFINDIEDLSFSVIFPQFKEIILQFFTICIIGFVHLKLHHGQFCIYNILELSLILYQLKLVELNKMDNNFFVHFELKLLFFINLSIDLINLLLYESFG